MKTRFKKTDLLFLVVVFLLLLLFYGGYRMMPQKEGAQVEITVNGKLYGTYPLDKDQTISVKTGGKVTNVLEIKDHKAFMKEADCPDHLCMKEHSISKENETIVCLPNKVVAAVRSSESEESEEYDVIVK